MSKKEKKQKPSMIQSPKGMHDILPDSMIFWDRIRKVSTEIAEYYNFLKIETPLVESAELFERTSGESSDIVSKQMFYVSASGKDKLVLRPEGTASIARSYIEHGLGQLGYPLKLYLEGPMFRYEQPQSGRFRQFHQLDFEIISQIDDAVYDAQIALVFVKILEELKLKNFSVSVNSIGCKNCRPEYKKELTTFYKSKKNKICDDCKSRLETNPLRILDCKESICEDIKKDAPIIVDKLCYHCKNHFKTFLEYLDELKIPYNLNHFLVRGLDYYTKTVFEVFVEGSPSAIGGGGRYDYLVESIGGKSSPAVGMAIGIERLIDAIKIQNIQYKPKAKQKIFLISIGDYAKKKSLSLVEYLRNNNIDVYESLGKDSLKAQMRVADKLQSPIAIIFGQKESHEETAMIRDMKNGVQEIVPLAKLAESIKKKLSQL